ncbi:hypothetical protein Glove_132g52 [Diversispora epigaea]|uniref:Tyrosine specific protein phosphatases domain-containing protein n=1 Tax=Diversispora epigaea TaxID=1348612 RepID=A0A397J6A2_9GLOM|nr:hypothetical protein Glove_132g52 [Diversispora epigaea]
MTTSSDPIFQRFVWVIPNRLARSSAPHYTGNDESQNMDDAAIEYLVNQGINNVISLNHFPLTDGGLQRRSIKYLHLPVADFTAPTIYQLRQAYESYLPAQRTTLVYCRYGQGRTGTVISAFMLLSGNQLTHNDYLELGVERQEQIDALDELAKEIEISDGDIRDEKNVKDEL